MKQCTIITLCVLIIISSCCEHSLIKRRYTKGYHLTRAGKLKAKHSDQISKKNPSTHIDTLVLARSVMESSLSKKNTIVSDDKQVHASTKHNQTHQRNTADIKPIQAFIKMQIKKSHHAVNNKMADHMQTRSDGWIAALKILAIIALVLVVLGILYIAFVLILLGGAFSGGAIYADPGFRMLMLLLLGLIILAAYLMYLVATADVNTYYKHDTNTSYDLNQNNPFKKNYFFDLLIFLKKSFIIVAIVILFLTIAYITIISLSNPITSATILILLFSILLLLLSAYKLKNDFIGA